MFKLEKYSSIRDKCRNYNVPEVNYSHQKLKIFKLYLTSRNVQKQIISINYIIYCLKHPKESPLDVDLFLLDDIPGLLCDTMNNHDSKLVRKVFICLTLLSTSALFYKERHAMIVLETTIRTMKILVKDTSQVTVIKNGLKLLSKILPRLQMENTSIMPKILSLVRDIVFTPLLQSLYLKVFFILQPIMKDLIQLSQCHLDLLYVFQRVLELLGNITNSSSINVYTIFMCDIIDNCLRLCCQLTLKKDNPPEENSTMATLLEKVRSLLWKNIRNIISPALINSDLKKCSVQDLNKILNCLLAALKKMSPGETKKLSQYLAAAGYLIALPKLNIRFRNEKLMKISKTLMSELVSQLCESTLKIGKFCNKNQFQFCIKKGLDALPIDISLWVEVLIHGSSSCEHYTIIIYTYFMLLTSMSPAILQDYHPAVCSYLISLKNPIPLPILKALWLIYAVTSLSTSGRQVSNKDSIRKASRTLIAMLNSQKNLQVVYTHHPAIIYWLFQSHYVDRKMQCTVMNLWFSDESRVSYHVMLQLVMSCHLASLCLFEVLRNYNLNVPEEGVRILTEVISRDKARGSSGLSAYIWENLTRILSCSSFSVKSVMKVNYILYLASQYIPSHLDYNLLVRLSVQVDKLLCRFTGQEECYTILRILLSRLGLNIIIITFSTEDFTILKIFLNNEKLIKVLVEASCVRYPYSIINSNLQFLAILIHCQHHYSVKSNTNINIKGDILLELLSHPKFEDITSTLTILSVMFNSTEKIRPLIWFNEQVEISFLQRLFYQLLMLCAKSELISKSCWKNQHLLLKFCNIHKIKDLEVQLATHPFTYLALQNCMLPSSSDFWKFVATWLEILQIKVSSVLNCKRSYYKPLCRDRMSTTIMDISHELIKQLNSETVNEVQQDIIMKILILKVNIPQDIVKALERKAFDFNKISKHPNQH